MGLVLTFFVMANKQRLLPSYAGEITPTPVTTARKTVSTMSEIDTDSGDLKRDKMTKSSEKEKNTRSESLES